MRAPGTATRGGRPGTGTQNFTSANLFVPQVTDRPVTQQGMAGPKTASGARRQVTDKNFYLGQLRQKRSELIEITNQLQVGVNAILLYSMYSQRGNCNSSGSVSYCT